MSVRMLVGSQGYICMKVLAPSAWWRGDGGVQDHHAGAWLPSAAASSSASTEVGGGVTLCPEHPSELQKGFVPSSTCCRDQSIQTPGRVSRPAAFPGTATCQTARRAER